MRIGTKTIVFPSTLLIVDDESTINEMLSTLFRDRGMSYETARSGSGALAIIRNTGISCLLVDKNLNDISGLDVIRETRKLQPYCACIVMTAYASTESVIEALRLGAIDYIEKPFDELELVAERVDLAIRNQQAHFEREALLERIRQFDAKVDTLTGNRVRTDPAATGTQKALIKYERLENALLAARDCNAKWIERTRELSSYVRNINLSQLDPVARDSINTIAGIIESTLSELGTSKLPARPAG